MSIFRLLNTTVKLLRKPNTKTFVTNSYQYALKKHPFILQSVQAGILMGVGDLIAQTIIEKTELKHVNWLRSGQFISIGLFFGGPGVRLWYGCLDRYIKTGSKAVIALKKVAADQLIFSPTFIAFLLGIINTMQGLSIKDTKEKIKAEYTDVLLTSYCIWPFVQIANFYLVPLNYQVLLVQFVALFWNSYLSWKTYSKKILLKVA